MRTMVLNGASRVYGKPQPKGHSFDVPEKEADVWAALGRARTADGAISNKAMGSQDNADHSSSELEALRAAYKAQSGQDADASWAIARIKSEMRKAGGARYNRRDMVAQDLLRS